MSISNNSGPKMYTGNIDDEVSSDNENNNSNVSELDKKKSLIDGNEKLLEAFISDFESERTPYKNEAEVVENYYARPRSPQLKLAD